MKRIPSFIEKIEKSGKIALIDLLKIVKNDVRTCTGVNLRRIMLLAGRTSPLNLHGADSQYHKIPESEKWRINLLKELIEVKHEGLVVEGMEQAEIEEILDFICTK
jgi:hypothetical protein